MTPDAAADQLARAVHRPVDRLAMYGLVDHHPWLRDPADFARGVVAELRAIEDGDLKLAAEACLTVAEFVAADEPGWWETPLGRLVMRAGPPGVDTLTVEEAQAALGVSRPTVYRMLQGGELERLGPGRVSADSVRAQMP